MDTGVHESGVTLVIVTFNLRWVVEMVLKKLNVTLPAPYLLIALERPALCTTTQCVCWYV